MNLFELKKLEDELKLQYLWLENIKIKRSNFVTYCGDIEFALTINLKEFSFIDRCLYHHSILVKEKFNPNEKNRTITLKIKSYLKYINEILDKNEDLDKKIQSELTYNNLNTNFIAKVYIKKVVKI